MQVSFSILRANGEKGKVYTAAGDAVVFGRSDECDVQLDDNYVSGRHAEILSIQGRFCLQDLNSTNGTWLGEGRIEGVVPIQDNAVIEFGKGGPKVRIVSLVGHADVFAKTPVANSVSREIQQNSLNTAREPGASRQNSNAGFLFISYVAAGCVAVVIGVVLSRQVFRSTVEQPPDPASPLEISSTEPGDAKAGEGTKTIAGEVALPPDAPSIDYAAIAESVRDQCVWIGLKSSEDGQTEILPFCAGWSPTGSYVVTTGTAVQIIQKRKWSVVVFSHLFGESKTGGFEDVDQFWVHPEFTDTREEYDVGIIRLPKPLPLKTTQIHQIARDDEWKSEFSSTSLQKILRCGYLIPAEPKAVSSIAMPEYTGSIVEDLEPLSSGSLSIHPLIKTSGMPQKIHGHAAVSANGGFLGTFYSRDSHNALIIPVDRIKAFSP